MKQQEMSNARPRGARPALPLLGVGCLMLAVVAIFGGCGRGKALPERVQQQFLNPGSGVFRVGTYGDPLELNPVLALGEGALGVSRLVHAAPLRKGPAGQYLPDAFASWSGFLDEEGNLVVEGVWRDGLQWHDGRVFDPRDLRFTLEAVKKPENRSPLMNLSSRVTAIDSFDRGRRTRIAFRGKSRECLDLLTVGLLPSHLLEGQALPDARIPVSFQRVNPTPGATQTLVFYHEFPVGLGRFRVTDRQRGQYLELQSYVPRDPPLEPPPAETAPGIGSSATDLPAESPEKAPASLTASQTILIRCHFKLESLIEDFRAGRLDWIGVPSEIAGKLEELKMAGVRFRRYPNPSYLLWGFNLRRPPFDQLVVRQALEASIDRGQIRSLIPYEGRVLDGAPLSSLATATPVLPADREKARQMLETAGFRDTDGDGVREWQGKPLRLNIVTNQDNLLRKVIAEKIVADLRLVGITAVVETPNWSDLIGTRLRAGDFDSFLLGFYAPPDGNWRALWHSVPAEAGASVSESLNFTGWVDPTADEALEKIDTGGIGPVPADALATLAERLRSTCPGVFLFQPMDVTAHFEAWQGSPSASIAWEEDFGAWRKSPAASPSPANL